ncbi:MAG: hypothetical protein ACM3IJ_04075 [Candidatus Levyibacteriota bacterium]
MVSPEGKRYGFEPVNEPGITVVRTKEASPVKCSAFFPEQQARSGIGSDLLSADLHVIERDLSTDVKEFAAIIEYPMVSIKLKHLMRELAVKPENPERAFSPRDISDQLTSFQSAATVGIRDDDKWGIVKKHGEVFASFMRRSSSSFSGLEQLCLDREGLWEEIISGKYAGFYLDVLGLKDAQDSLVSGFLTQVVDAVRDAGYVWGGKRIPGPQYQDRILKQLGKVGPGAKRSIMEQVAEGDEEEIIKVHQRVFHMVELRTPAGDSAFVKSSGSVRARAMGDRENVAILDGGNIFSTVRVEDGEDGIHFHMLSQEKEPTVLVPLISWKKDQFGFRHWNLQVVSDVSAARIPIGEGNPRFSQSVAINAEQFNPLLGLMVVDLLDPSARKLWADNFGINRTFYNPAFSPFGSVLRKDILLESDFLRRAERHVANHTKQ